MEIIDITKFLVRDSNYFCFNNSTVKIGKNLYAVVYRIIKYKSEKLLTPWEVWWKPTNLFSSSECKIYKIRDKLGSDILIRDTDECKLPDVIEYDSTGLAIFHAEGLKWKIVKNIPNLFNEYNHDCRISKINGDYYLTYYGFITDKTKMLWRKICFGEDYIYLSHERELLENYPFTHAVEKHCSFTDQKDVYYNINGEFIIWSDDVVVRQTPIKDITLFYKNKIVFSLGTPGLSYKKNFLLAGHVKYEYKNIGDGSPLKDFTDSLNFTGIKKHGKYIYLMFLFEHDENYNITRLSGAFIPVDTVKYYLVFPMSIINYEDKIMISYGEGDEFCKHVIFEPAEIEKLLIPIEKITPQNYTFSLLYKPRILHCGYFGEWNCGDDVFIRVFRQFYEKKYGGAYYAVDYKRRYGVKYAKVIYGGGDIINDYFCNSIDPAEENHALGVGIPFTDHILLLKKFASVTLRYSGDKKLAKKHGIIVKTIPDLAFYWDPPKCKISEESVIVAMPRTHCRVSSDYAEFIKCFGTAISGLDAELLPFCITSKLQENDHLINAHIASYSGREIKIAQTDNYVEEIYGHVARAKFVIAGRFHAHIFALMLGKPFISVSCSRKCINLMREFNLEENLFILPQNEKCSPTKFSTQALKNFIADRMANTTPIKFSAKSLDQLKNILIDNF